MLRHGLSRARSVVRSLCVSGRAAGRVRGGLCCSELYFFINIKILLRFARTARVAQALIQAMRAMLVWTARAVSSIRAAVLSVWGCMRLSFGLRVLFVPVRAARCLFRLCALFVRAVAATTRPGFLLTHPARIPYIKFIYFIN